MSTENIIMVKSTDINLPDFEKCQAVAIDLDGTLLDSKSNLSARSRAALEQCISDGLAVIIATSRAERSVRQLLGDKLADKCSLVMENGGVIRGATPLSGFRREVIPQEVATKVVRFILAIEPAVRVGIELDGFEFGCNQAPDSRTLWSLNRATPDMVLSLDEALRREPTKIWVNGLGQDLSVMAQELSRQFNDFLAVFPNAGFKFLDMPSKRASKSMGVRYLLKSRHIALRETVAFGDDLPDVEMLEICGIPIAVANAVPEVLACANFHTASNDKDGVAIVLERIIAAKNQRD
ncbi:MAG: HAD-IIB family hydrolase [Chloroflexi bacterium]|nr:HAD-IIB family hydrolase [Chloroflexota bacterium]